MAAGDTLCIFKPQANEPPASAFATFNTLNNELELDFAQSVVSSAVFRGVLPRNYATNGLTVNIHFATPGTTGNCEWSCAFERNEDGTSSLASDNFASAQTVIKAVNGTTEVITLAQISFTDGAQMASIAAGETFRMKISRVGTGGSDTLSAVAQLFAIEIEEA
jgi:hypothetical protein